MITKFWYSVQNGGDGSAYPEFFESKELAEFDQNHMDEGWGEDCMGYISIQHTGKIKLLNEVITLDMLVERYKEQFCDGREYQSYNKSIQEKIDKLIEIKKHKKER